LHPAPDIYITSVILTGVLQFQETVDEGGASIKNGGGVIGDTNAVQEGKVACIYNSGTLRNTTAGPSVNMNRSIIAGNDGGCE
jgi:hypothetical protein